MSSPFAQMPCRAGLGRPNSFGSWLDFQDPRDFLRYTQTMGTGTSPAIWTVTVTGSTPTAVVTGARGGTFVLTMSSSANDKFIGIEAQKNVKLAVGDSLVFNVGFTTGANTDANAFYGLAGDVANAATATTGYIADGVALQVINGVAYLWTGLGATTTATMTVTTLETLAASTTYHYQVEVLCQSTAGAGEVRVLRYDANGAVAWEKSWKQSGDIPYNVLLGQIWGCLAISTNSNVFTYDYWGYAQNRVAPT